MTEPISHVFTGQVPTDLQTTWQAFSDSERFNRLAGIDLHFDYAQTAEGPSTRRGRMRHLGVTLTWDELPVLFDAPRHFLIVRRYHGGPATRFESEMLLTPLASGTQVEARFRYYPRSELLRGAVRLDAAWLVRPQLAKAFRSILTALQEGRPVPDAPPPPLRPEVQRHLRQQLAAVAPDVAQHLEAHLQTAPLQDQLRLRPLELARHWHMAPKDVTIGLLAAAQAGVLRPQWEVICPSCRLPTTTQPTFSLETKQQHCVGCDVRYDASFADSVALSLQPTPEIRSVLGKVDCLSSPARMPHIIGQIVVAPRDEVAWEVTLEPGSYRLRSLPELEQVSLIVRPDLPRHDVTVLAGPKVLTPPTLRLGAGNVTLRLRSKLDAPLTVVLEHAQIEPDTLTVGRVLEWPEAAKLLPLAALEPGLAIAPWTGPLLAVHVARGGTTAEQAVANLLREQGARSVQVSTGWVLATLPDWPALGRMAPHLADALWLRAAVGFGTVMELTAGKTRVASGALLQELVALAHEAEPGQIAVHSGEAPELADWQVASTVHGAELVTHRKHAPLVLPTLATRPLQTGDTVDARFVLGEVLGQGGFGLVYAARDKARQDDVVVKLLRHELADDPTQIQRFFDEGRLASRLRGPHAVHVHEWGLADDGRLFLAMERLNGQELADVLKTAGTLDPVRAAQLAIQALHGLAEAHAQGLVHRDVKPQNLFILHVGEANESVKVIDYGIAVDRTGRVKSSEPAGQIIGTPLYMAPEQVTGEPLDGRCDLYAIGLVLYQALTGRLPFGGENPIAILMARLVQVPALLDEVCRQPLPPGLAALVDQALAREPQNRPHDADAMASALENVLPPERDLATWREKWQQHRVDAAFVDAHTVDAMSALDMAETQIAETEITQPGQRQPR
jgi:hypothetical protein